MNVNPSPSVSLNNLSERFQAALAAHQAAFARLFEEGENTAANRKALEEASKALEAATRAVGGVR